MNQQRDMFAEASRWLFAMIRETTLRTVHPVNKACCACCCGAKQGLESRLGHR